MTETFHWTVCVKQLVIKQRKYIFQSNHCFDWFNIGTLITIHYSLWIEGKCQFDCRWHLWLKTLPLMETCITLDIRLLLLFWGCITLKAILSTPLNCFYFGLYHILIPSYIRYFSENHKFDNKKKKEIKDNVLNTCQKLQKDCSLSKNSNFFPQIKKIQWYLVTFEFCKSLKKKKHECVLFKFSLCVINNLFRTHGVNFFF